jgi:hypothetical protein
MALDPGDELRIGELVARYADAVNRADADQWKGTWAEQAQWHLRTTAVTGRDCLQVTTYTDRYVRAGDGWLFARRRLVVHYSRETSAGEFTGWAPAALDV